MSQEFIYLEPTFTLNIEIYQLFVDGQITDQSNNITESMQPTKDIEIKLIHVNTGWSSTIGQVNDGKTTDGWIKPNIDGKFIIKNMNLGQYTFYTRHKFWRKDWRTNWRAYLFCSGHYSYN